MAQANKRSRRSNARTLAPRGATIIHHENGRLTVRVTDDEGHRTYRRAGRDEDRARSILNELVADREAHRTIGGGDLTFEKWLDVWEPTLAAEGYKPSALERIQSIVRVHLRPSFGWRKLRAITPQVVKRYRLARSEAGAKNQTIKNELNTLSLALDAAVLERHITANPVRAVRNGERTRYRSSRKLKDAPGFVRGKPVPTLEEVDEFLAGIPSDHPDRHTITFLFRTGFRVGEAAGLTFDDVNVDTMTVNVVEPIVWVRGRPIAGPPKSPNSARTIAVQPEAMAAALSRAPAEGDLSGTLVFEEIDGVPLKADRFDGRFKTLARRAGHPDWTPHKARHHIASVLITAGYTAAKVAFYIGDTEEMVLRVYGHLFPSEHAAVGAAIAETLAQRPKKAAAAPPVEQATGEA
ncbi:MAG: tyrosine-type recombinase/integrase [Chloroflexi bacterium]|nr:tyrosine-type recombinase/integrase [Chloroflexota bacterium]